MKINEHIDAVDVKCVNEVLPVELRLGVKSISRVTVDVERFNRHLENNNIKCGVERNKLFHGAGNVMFRRIITTSLLSNPDE